MNTETNTSPSTAETPANVDDIIQKFLKRANEFASDQNGDPKVLCALGWLVVKMKAAQTKAATTGQPVAKCVTEETVNEFKRSEQIG